MVPGSDLGLVHNMIMSWSSPSAKNTYLTSVVQDGDVCISAVKLQSSGILGLLAIETTRNGVYSLMPLCHFQSADKYPEVVKACILAVLARFYTFAVFVASALKDSRHMPHQHANDLPKAPCQGMTAS